MIAEIAKNKLSWNIHRSDQGIGTLGYFYATTPPKSYRIRPLVTHMNGCGEAIRDGAMLRRANLEGGA